MAVAAEGRWHEAPFFDGNGSHVNGSDGGYEENRSPFLKGWPPCYTPLPSPLRKYTATNLLPPCLSLELLFSPSGFLFSSQRGDFTVPLRPRTKPPERGFTKGRRGTGRRWVSRPPSPHPSPSPPEPSVSRGLHRTARAAPTDRYWSRTSSPTPVSASPSDNVSISPSSLLPLATTAPAIPWVRHRFP